VIKEQAGEALDDLARQLGMYVEHYNWIPTPDGQEALVVDFVLGDIAFSDRIQNPQKYSTDDAIRRIAKQLEADTFLDERTRLKEVLAQGGDVLEGDI
jgi:hypothetical protein